MAQVTPLSRYSPPTTRQSVAIDPLAGLLDYQHESDHDVRYIGAQFHGVPPPRDHIDITVDTSDHEDTKVTDSPIIDTERCVTTDFDSRYPHLTNQLGTLSSCSSGTVTPERRYTGSELYPTNEPHPTNFTAVSLVDGLYTNVALDAIDTYGLRTARPPTPSTNQTRETGTKSNLMKRATRFAYNTAARRPVKTQEIESEEKMDLGRPPKKRRAS
ncbi:hypothetical protein GGS26DRAFT_594230 [Hypomontagnella submonticulosa]|nr:hypothetical protein GGS26DRAFT_594230 [Hypomontagnella submonticulosa]